MHLQCTLSWNKIILHVWFEVLSLGIKKSAPTQLSIDDANLTWPIMEEKLSQWALVFRRSMWCCHFEHLTNCLHFLVQLLLNLINRRRRSLGPCKRFRYLRSYNGNTEIKMVTHLSSPSPIVSHPLQISNFSRLSPRSADILQLLGFSNSPISSLSPSLL